MGLTMSEDGGLELLVEFFIAAANFRSNSSKRACKSASPFSRRSQFGHPLPLLMAVKSNGHPQMHKHQFQIREQLPNES